MSNKQDLDSAAKTICDFVKNAEKVEEHLEKREEIEELRKDKATKEEYYEKMIGFIKAKNKTGELSRSTYIFRASFYIISVHEDRWLNQKYQADLDPISQKMKEIEREYGLSEDQYWTLDEGPDEWQKLNQEYNEILDKKLLKVYREFDLSEIADLIENHNEEYERLYEEGKETTFNTKSEIEKLSLIVEKYKREAYTSIKSDAYFASTILSGAAIEALLLLEVLKRSEEVEVLIESMPGNEKPKSDPKTWNLYELINIANKANWLPRIQIEDNVFLLDALSHVVRIYRNFLHPGRILREKLTTGIEKSEAELANSVLTVLEYAIEYMSQENEEA